MRSLAATREKYLLGPVWPHPQTRGNPTLNQRGTRGGAPGIALAMTRESGNGRNQPRPLTILQACPNRHQRGNADTGAGAVGRIKQGATLRQAQPPCVCRTKVCVADTLTSLAWPLYSWPVQRKKMEASFEALGGTTNPWSPWRCSVGERCFCSALCLSHSKHHCGTTGI